MKKTCALAIILLLLPSCFATSGLVGEEPLSQVDKAREEAVKAALLSAWQAETTYYLENKSFTADPALLNMNVPGDVSLSFSQLSQADFCVEGTHNEATHILWHIQRDDVQPAEGTCP